MVFSAEYASLWMMSANGDDASKLTQVTSPFEVVRDPVCSPDGTKIAYTRLGGTYFALHETVVIDRDGTDLRVLSAAGTIRGPLAWSPDGTRLAGFGSDDALVQINVDGSGLSTILPQIGYSIQRYPLSWSPDGAEILYVGIAESIPGFPESTGDALRAVNVRSGVSRVVSVGYKSRFGRWSPDGQRIALSTPPSSDLIVADREGAIQRVMWGGPGVHDLAFTWSKDGKEIIFSLGDSLEALDIESGARRSFGSQEFAREYYPHVCGTP